MPLRMRLHNLLALWRRFLLEHSQLYRAGWRDGWRAKEDDDAV